MQVGYNHNVKHKGKEYHIQTEDSGEPSKTITTLLYSEGTIVGSRKMNYSKIASEYENYESQLRELMQKQHKQMLMNLKNGDFDDPELAEKKEPLEVQAQEDKTIFSAIESVENGATVDEETKKNEELRAAEWRKGELSGSGAKMGEIDKKSSDFGWEIVSSLINTLLSLTQKDVMITKEREDVSTLKQASSQFDGKIIVCQTKLSGDVSAECAFICDMKTASIISDLVLLGAGAPKEELTADDLDAIKETMNQCFGASVQTISSAFGVKVFFDPIKVSSIDGKENNDTLSKLFSENDIFAFQYFIKLGGILDSKLHFYLSSSIKKYLTLKQEIKPTAEKAKETPVPVTKAEEEVEMFETINDISEKEEERPFRNIELINGIEVDVKIKLGESIMPLKRITKLTPGTILELNKDVDSQLELVINNKTIAEGVLVVVSSNNFALRVTKILDQATRIKNLAGFDDY